MKVSFPNKEGRLFQVATPHHKPLLITTMVPWPLLVTMLGELLQLKRNSIILFKNMLFMLTHSFLIRYFLIKNSKKLSFTKSLKCSQQINNVCYLIMQFGRWQWITVIEGVQDQFRTERKHTGITVNERKVTYYL